MADTLIIPFSASPIHTTPLYILEGCAKIASYLKRAVLHPNEGWNRFFCMSLLLFSCEIRLKALIQLWKSPQSCKWRWRGSWSSATCHRTSIKALQSCSLRARRWLAGGESELASKHILLRFLPHGRLYGPSDSEYERNERKRRVWGEVEVLKSEEYGLRSNLHL